MQRLILTTIFILHLGHIGAQWNDRYWITGYNSSNSGNGDFGSTYFDFFEEPVKIIYTPAQSLDMKECSMIGIENDGTILFYSNCMSIRAADHSMIDNGDTIAWSAYWTAWQYPNGETIGFPIPQGGLALPLSPTEYGLFYSIADIDIEGTSVDRVGQILFTRILKEPHQEISIEEKDILVLSDTLAYGKIAGCRHANGRDWWVLIPENKGTKYYSLLVTTDEIKIDSFNVGNMYSPIYGVGHSYFTPDGSKYIRYDAFEYTSTGARIAIYDFDRCTGLLSNERWWEIPCTSLGGIAISPNSRFLYSSDAFSLYQYDLNAENIKASKTTVANWDGYVEPNWFETYFGMMSLAPDGRIYITPPTGGSRVMHVIDRPNFRGNSCHVLQHQIQLPTWNARTLPNYPNFRLGPLDGSGCDTLDLDNFPVARFRHEPKSDDPATIRFSDLSYYEPTSWSWDFGDGEFASGPEQIHTYQQTGIYQVCLTVSNMNGSHTSCQEVYAETPTSYADPIIMTPKVSPNPFSDYIDIDVQGMEILSIRLMDSHGRKMLDTNMTCPCRINLQHLLPGMYFCRIVTADGEEHGLSLVKN